MVTFEPSLLMGAISGSMFLSWPGSILMSIAHGTIKSHKNAHVLDHVGALGLCCPGTILVCIASCVTWGYSVVQTMALLIVMVPSQPWSELISVAPGTIKDYDNARGLGHDDVQMLCQSEWSKLPLGDMVKSDPGLLMRMVSGSMVLP